MRRLENEDEDKFWEAWVKDDLIFCYKYGKIGSNGHIKLKKFKTPAEAQAELEEKLAEKIGEGFVEVGEGAAAAKPAAPASKPAPAAKKKAKDEDEDADDEDSDDDEDEAPPPPKKAAAKAAPAKPAKDEDEDADDEDSDDDEDEDEDEDSDEDEDDSEDEESEEDDSEDEDESEDSEEDDEDEDAPRKKPARAAKPAPKPAAAAAPEPPAKPTLAPRVVPRLPTPERIARATDTLVALKAAVGGRSWKVERAAHKARYALESLGGLDLARHAKLSAALDDAMALAIAPKKRLPLEDALTVLWAVDARTFARVVSHWRAKMLDSVASASIGVLAATVAGVPDAELAAQVATALVNRRLSPAAFQRWFARLRPFLAEATKVDAFLATLKPGKDPILDSRIAAAKQP